MWNFQWSVCLCFCLLFRLSLRRLFALGHAVAKGHKAVVEMDIFGDNVVIFQREIEVAEVPEAAHAAAVENVPCLLRAFLGQTENSGVHRICLAVLRKTAYVQNSHTIYPGADKRGIVVEYRSQLKSS